MLQIKCMKLIYAIRKIQKLLSKIGSKFYNFNYCSDKSATVFEVIPVPAVNDKI